jgi:hypothetical protein
LDAVERGDLDAASRAIDAAMVQAGRRNESGAVIDIETGEVIQESHVGVPVKERWEDNVSFGQSVYLLERDIAITHTHPDETGLSDGDLKQLGWGHIKKVQAVSPSGKTFTMSKPEGVFVTPNQIEKTWQQFENEIFDSGRYSDMEVSEMIEEINQKITDKFGFIYSKNEPKLNPLEIPTVVRDNQGNVIPPSQRFQSTEKDIRYNPLGYDITTVVEDIKRGRTDGPLRAINSVVKQSTELRDRIKRESEKRQRPRAVGQASIIERIARERSGGRISEQTAQALTDFVNTIRPDAIGDTSISIRGAGNVSNFDFANNLVSFYLTQDKPELGARIGIHEFWHGLSRFLPKEEVGQMSQDYNDALLEYIKKNPWFLAFVGRYSLTPEQYEDYKLFNPKEAETKLTPVRDAQGNITKYQIVYDNESYRYIMLDEWIAESMTDLVREKQAMPDTFLGKLAKIFREFMDMIQVKLGNDPYESFYQLVTDPKKKLQLYRVDSVARPFQIYQPQTYDYSGDFAEFIRYNTLAPEPEVREATQKHLDAVANNNTEEAQRLTDEVAKVRNYNSENLLFHGTTHIFNVFTKDRSNVENDFGKGGERPASGRTPPDDVDGVVFVVRPPAKALAR